MAHQFDVIALGELNPDLILSGFEAPGPVLGTEQAFEAETLSLGSSTAIACVLMQRLGLRMSMISLVGDDDYGRFCLDRLAQEGVDTKHVKVSDAVRTGVTISVSYAADRLLLTRFGTIAGFGAGDVPVSAFAQARHLHSGSFFIQSSLRPDLPDLFARARAQGLTTSLDLGWDPTGDWDSAGFRAVLPHCDVVLPNRSELRAVTGEDDLAAGIAALHAMGAGEIVVKCGAAGASHSRGGDLCHQPAMPLETVVDTTGAGDAFNAGYLRGWLAGLPPETALSLGNACGALTASATGGTGGLHDLTQARDMLRCNGVTFPDLT